MENKDKVFVVLQVLPTVTSVLIVVLGYFYVYRFQVKESKASTKLSQIETNLKEIESEMKKVKEALEVSGKKVQISGDVGQMISDLRPKLNVEFDPKVLYYDQKISINFHLTNLGKHCLSIGFPEISLSTEKIWGKDAVAGKLSANVDYSLQVGFAGLYIAPGQTITRPLDIVLLKGDFKRRHLYFCASFDAETDPKIIETLAGLVGDLLTKDTLHDIARSSAELFGDFTPPE